MRIFSDFAIGQRFSAGPIAVTENEIIAFAQRYDPQPFHLDPVAARGTIFRGLSASGWMTAALTMRLLVDSGFNSDGGLVGREVESLKWLQPVRPGDSLRAISEIVEVTPSRSKANRGWVRFRTDTLNQKNEVVQTMLSCALMSQKDPNA